MKKWLSLSVISLFSLPFVWSQGRVDRVSESGDSLRLSRAVELTTDGISELNLGGDESKARRMFERAIESDSNYAPAKYSISQLLINSAPDSAMLYARSAWESDTTNHWYLSQYAQSMISAGKYAQSRQLYEKLVKMRPMDLNAYRVLAILYQQDSKPEKAIELLDSAEVRTGRNPFLMAMKRQLLLSTNQVDRAINEAREMVEEAPFMAENRVALAELYSDLRQDSLARVEFDAAVEIDSTRIETLMLYGEFFKSRAMMSDYLDILLKVILSESVDLDRKVRMVREVRMNNSLYEREKVKINTLISVLYMHNTTNRDVVELYTQNLITLGMLDKASETLKKRLDDEPAQMVYYRMLIDIERYSNRADSARYYIHRAMERFPENRDLRSELAYQYVAENNYDAAIETLKSSMDGAADSLQSTLWGTIGDITHQGILHKFAKDSTKVVGSRDFEKNMREVYKCYKNSIKLDPHNAMVMNNYAYFLCEYGGDLEQALEISARSNELESGNATFIDTYAWILYRLARYEEAKTEMRRAVSLDKSNNYEIALHYGEILSVLGESTMADFYWDRAKQWGAEEAMIEQSRQRAEGNRVKVE